MEVTTGLGMMLGPLIGTLLYDLGGYALPFFILSAVVILPMPSIITRLPTITKT